MLVFKDEIKTLEDDLDIVITELNNTIDCGSGEPDDDDDDDAQNSADCEALIAALEALAAKDFTTNCATPEDIAALGSQLNELANTVGGLASDLNQLAERVEGLNKEVGFIRQATGVDEFLDGDNWQGFDVPKNIKNRKEGLRKITNIPDHTSWLFCQIEALIGNFPRKVTVEDTEIDEAGAQKATIELPNLAETLAEIYGLLLNTDTATDAILRASISTLAETLSIRQLAIKNFCEVESIAEFLGFAQKPIKKKVWFTADLSGKRIDQVLQPKQLEIVVNEFDDEKEEFDYQTIAKTVFTTYAILSARYLNPVNMDNPEGSIKEDLIKLKGLTDPEDEDEFDVWTERAEGGFTDAPGIKDIHNPYGRRFERRPRIRDIDPEGTEDIP
ncbi:MAG: hypothetical protein F6J87_27175 [Spirulina sp. SIO3F2]|nr:hypothetical protein [Spirulina sp. SIO3F2]